MENAAISLTEEEVLYDIISTGYFIQCRRFFRRYFIVSRKHPQTMAYYKSRRMIQKQEYIHLVYNYFMIHPFSIFNLYWSYVMAFIFWVCYLSIPFHFGLPLSKHGSTRWILLICHIFHTMHIVLCFFTGYYDATDNVVVLSQSKIVKRYLYTYFLPDALSIVPVILVNPKWYRVDEIAFLKALSFFLYLKVVRIKTWLEYLDLIKASFGLHSYVLTIFKMIMLFVCVILWTDTLIMHRILNQFAQTYNEYFIEVEQVIEILLLVDIQRIESRLMSIGGICLGFMFQLTLYVWISHIWTKYNSATLSQDSFYREVDAYMSYTALPVRKRARIKIFFDFKYQGTYYKEHSLHTVMSEKLIKEVMYNIAQCSVRKVNLFKNLPENIIRKFTKYLSSEIYLPGDIIIHSGSKGDAMYFIVAGTVGIMDPNGHHVCFLKDGATFGEIALILNVLRVATVVAVTPCEILKLSRHNFLNAFKRCSSELDLLQNVANQRLAELSSMSAGAVIITDETVMSSYSKTNISSSKYDLLRDSFFEKEMRRKTFTPSEENLLHESSQHQSNTSLRSITVSKE